MEKITFSDIPRKEQDIDMIVKADIPDMFSVNGTLTVLLRGAVTEDTVQDFRKRLDILMETQKPETLIIDFSEVTALDNFGVGLIVGRYNTALAYGGTLRVVNANKDMARALTLSGLDRLVNTTK